LLLIFVLMCFPAWNCGNSTFLLLFETRQFSFKLFKSYLKQSNNQPDKQAILKHHPDKQKDRCDALFKQIHHAYTILSDPVKRKQYDSVDPYYDETEAIPLILTPQDFFTAFSKIFDREARLLYFS
jgi:hypothetical protein